jgi:hypothetical protein
MAPVITELTIELVTKVWPTKNAANQYLKRGGTNATKLGCIIQETQAGARLEPSTMAAQQAFEALELRMAINARLVAASAPTLTDAEFAEVNFPSWSASDGFEAVLKARGVFQALADQPITVEALEAAAVPEEPLPAGYTITEVTEAEAPEGDMVPDIVGYLNQPVAVEETKPALTAYEVAVASNTILRFKAADSVMAYDAAKLIAKRFGVQVVIDRFDGTDLTVIEPGNGNGNGEPKAPKKPVDDSLPWVLRYLPEHGRLTAPGKNDQLLIDLALRPEGVTGAQYQEAAGFGYMPPMAQLCIRITGRWPGYTWTADRAAKPTVYHFFHQSDR